MNRIAQIGVVVILAILLFSATTVQNSNKLGYVNSLELLDQMPAVKQAKSKLNAQKQQSEKLLQAQAKKFQDRYQKALQDAQAGKLSPNQQKNVEKELATLQESVLKSERKMQQDLMKKEQQLFKPIQTKVKNAIKAVAKKKGYRFIFDSSAGLILHAEESDNLLPAVKAQLGM